ncbi:MAG TPA: cupin domain-containing protein [Thermomicrobiales bacterium]|nr:cupin domain-containing protein [Thermomicrobiales bacterium]
MIENQLGDNDKVYGTFDLNEVMNEFPPDPNSQSLRRAEILVKTDTLRVVLITMLKGSRLHDHTAPGPITIQVLKGSMNVSVESASQVLTPGEMVALGPGVVHAVEAVEEGAFLLTIAHLSRIPDQGGNDDIPAMR